MSQEKALNDTFGFMDPKRGVDKNHDLYKKSCNLAIAAFAAEGICDISSYAGDSLEDLLRIMPEKCGPEVNCFRMRYFNENKIVRPPEIQSFFLYAFTLGLNKHSPFLMSKEDLEDIVSNGPPAISNDEILNRQFPILGPQWLCEATNREMPHLEDVFCDFQDKFILPIAKKTPVDMRLLSDAIALVFHWGKEAGYYWFREVIAQIDTEVSSPYSKGVEPIAMYQVKRSMSLIDRDDIGKVTALGEAFFGD